MGTFKYSIEFADLYSLLRIPQDISQSITRDNQCSYEADYELAKPGSETQFTLPQPMAYLPNKANTPPVRVMPKWGRTAPVRPNPNPVSQPKKQDIRNAYFEHTEDTESPDVFKEVFFRERR